MSWFLSYGHLKSSQKTPVLNSIHTHTLAAARRARGSPADELSELYLRCVCVRARALASQHPREREREPNRVREGERLGQRRERRGRERGEGGA